MLKSPALWLALVLPAASVFAAHRPAPAPAGPHPEVIGFWHFERDMKPESKASAAGPLKRLGGPEFFFNDDVPGPFIYDPLQRLSYPNTASLSFQSDEKHNDALEIALNTAKTSLAGQSVTLELFFKPNAEWDGPLAMKARQNESASEWGLEARYFAEQRQTYLHAFFTAPGGQTEHFRGGHHGTSVQIQGQSTDWRHIAFVYDATAKTVACYVDYYQCKTVPIPGEMKWDAGALYLGGGPEHSSFSGLIDEVRLTKAALRPAQFLHARKDPIVNVNLEGPETLLPRDAGLIDVKECFGALGDGRTDDTAAFRDAFRVLSSQAPFAHNTLYVPPGTYLISDTLQSGRSLTVQGAGADKTVLKLRDKCPGFNKAAEPRPFWQVDNSVTANAPNANITESTPGASIYNLTLDTGKGNAGAKALEIHAPYVRRLDSLTLRSADGAGVAGLDLTAAVTGSSILVKSVHIKGFDSGVLCSAANASTTLEQLALEGQRTTGIRNNGGILAIHALTSVNHVPAIVSAGAGSMVTLLDSALKGGGKDSTAVQSEGALYALRVETAGYKSAIRQQLSLDEKTRESKQDTIPGPKVDEYLAEQVITGHGSLAKPLKLPVQTPPEIPWGDIHKEWVNVEKYTEKKAGNDWAPAIQAAIDSGAKTIYFPEGRYEVLDSIHLHGKVDRLLGNCSRIVRGSSVAADLPVLIFDQTDARHTVSLERLQVEGLRHASPATLLLKSTDPGQYDSTEGCGKLFLEDVSASDFQFQPSQSVWTLDWNCANHRVLSHGANVWCLGFVAGGGETTITQDTGAHLEMLGGFTRPNIKPLFGNADSQISLIYGADATDPGSTTQIVDAQAEETKEIKVSDLKQYGNRTRVDLFISDASIKAAAK